MELQALDDLESIEIPDNDVSLNERIYESSVNWLTGSMYLYLITLFKYKKIGRRPHTRTLHNI
jgi:hypothetical protein